MDYIAFMHGNGDSRPTPEQWDAFLKLAHESGLFRGGSAIGKRQTVGSKPVPDSTQHIRGYMRFAADSFDQLAKLLNQHPVVVNGGTVEVCELPKD